MREDRRQFAAHERGGVPASPAYIHGMWFGTAYIHGMRLGTAYIHGILLGWQRRAAA